MRRSADVTQPDLRAARGKPPRQMSLMHVFRASAETGDAKQDHMTTTAEADGPGRAQRAARGAIDEAELRRHLALDLESLITTVQLDASVPLSDMPHVAQSVINFGFADLSRAGGTAHSRTRIAEAIANALRAFEPRLLPGSLSVAPSEEEGTDTNRLTFHVQAEIAADPADLPLDFLAEVDLGAGKLSTKRLRLQR